MTLYWPRHVLRSSTPQFDLAPLSLSGPVSDSGVSDVVQIDPGYWTCTLGGVHVRGETMVRTWRGLAAQVQGKSNPIIVPLCRAYQPLPVVSGAYDAVPHSDDSLFSDDAGYVGATMRVRSDVALARRATSVVATVDYGDTIEPGHRFSFGHRLYEVVTATYSTETNVAISFKPPLREAVMPLDELNFAEPVCRMRLKDDGQMKLPLTNGREATLSVEFVEDLSA